MVNISPGDDGHFTSMALISHFIYVCRLYWLTAGGCEMRLYAASTRLARQPLTFTPRLSITRRGVAALFIPWRRQTKIVYALRQYAIAGVKTDIVMKPRRRFAESDFADIMPIYAAAQEDEAARPLALSALINISPS